MGVPVIVAKALLTASTDKNGRNIIAIIIAALLTPFITIILIILSLFGNVESANNSLLDYSFTDIEIPADFNDEQREAIEDMRNHLAELDDIIAEKEESGFDGNMVKAVFYSLQFGVPVSAEESGDEESEGSSFDYAGFCDCFQGLTIEQLDTALDKVSAAFPQYTITENHKQMINSVYKYLNGGNI